MNRVEKGFRAAAAAGIILFSGCLESPKPPETLQTETWPAAVTVSAPKTETLSKEAIPTGRDFMKIVIPSAVLLGAGLLAYGSALLKRREDW